MAAIPEPSRYDRQMLFARIGPEGQRQLAASRVAIVGCGALGTSLSEQLVRAGTGSVTLIDRDIVEASNLGRQALFTEADARAGLPKAVALAGHLAEFNPEVEVTPVVADVVAANAEELLAGHDLILDGCDNFDTRYLMNDLAVSRRIPWIYGACVGARGLTAVILPETTPCLRCLFPEPPPPGSTETCDTVGIIGPAAGIVACVQAAEALKILVGALDEVRRTLLSIELWPFRVVELGGADQGPTEGCPACSGRTFPWLDGVNLPRASAYCGRDSVQILPAEGRGPVDLDALEARLRDRFPCRRNEFVLRIEVPNHAVTVFDDGRALVSGTGDVELARSLFDRYIGS